MRGLGGHGRRRRRRSEDDWYGLVELCSGGLGSGGTDPVRRYDYFCIPSGHPRTGSEGSVGNRIVFPVIPITYTHDPNSPVVEDSMEDSLEDRVHALLLWNQAKAVADLRTLNIWSRRLLRLRGARTR